MVSGHGRFPHLLRQCPGMRDVALHRGHLRGRGTGSSLARGQGRAGQGEASDGGEGERANGPAADRGERGAGRCHPGRAAATLFHRPGGHQPRGTARGEQQPGQRGPGQRHEERQQRGTAVRDPADRGSLRLAHGQSAPGKGIGPPVTEGLYGNPPASDGDRPGPQAQHQPLAKREHCEDHSLGDRQGGPRVPGDVDQPGQQRNEERQAEPEPDGEGTAQAPPPERDGEQRRPGRCERPETGRRECRREAQAPGDRQEQRGEHGQAGALAGLLVGVWSPRWSGGPGRQDRLMRAARLAG